MNGYLGISQLSNEHIMNILVYISLHIWTRIIQNRFPEIKWPRSQKVSVKDLIPLIPPLYAWGCWARKETEVKAIHKSWKLRVHGKWRKYYMFWGFKFEYSGKRYKFNTIPLQGIVEMIKEAWGLHVLSWIAPMFKKEE